MSEQLKNTLTALLILVMVVTTVVTLVVTMPNLAGIERVVYGDSSIDKESIEEKLTTTSKSTTGYDKVTENNVKTTQQVQTTTTYKEISEAEKMQNGGVNINTATKEELMRVPGIGEVYADRIIAYREQYGNFETLNELTNIKGIGEKRLEKWSTYLIIS